MHNDYSKQIKYFKSPQGKEALKRASKKYRNSERGKIAYEKCRLRLKQKDPDYNKTYLRMKRDEAKKNGLCPQCFKSQPVQGKKLCMSCCVRINGHPYKESEWTT